MDSKITALLIMPRQCRRPLLEQLEACSIGVLPASDCSEARRILERRPAVDVVLSDATLPDGDWSSVLEDLLRSRIQAELIVCARLADTSLWCEVLQRGAYDLLVEPYRKEEVQRIVETAAARNRLHTPAWDPFQRLRASA